MLWSDTPLPVVTVDAFAHRPFAGNPAAVVILPLPLPDEWMQATALEMHLSETAFLISDGDGAWALRWFTPTVEVDLCGHATLASAHVLWENGALPLDETARFFTRSGELTARRLADGWIELDFPAKVATPAPEPPGLAAALGVSIRALGKSAFDYLVEVDSEEIVRAVKPDLAALRELPVRGVIVTARASLPESVAAGYDIVSRFFGPGAGVDEDPVTGSAHTALGPYWSAPGRLGKDDMIAYQASARGGVLRVGVRGDRVLLAGQAVTMMRGAFVYR